MITFSKLGNYGRFGNQLWQIASTIGIANRNHQPCAFPTWKYQKYFPNHLPQAFLGDLSRYKAIDYDGLIYREFNLGLYQDYDLHGYFQSERYFKPYEGQIRELFTNNAEIMSNFPVDTVAIHVRRGDYLERSDYHTVLGMDYYQEAMNLFPGRNFCIFSDDINWCITKFPIGCVFMHRDEEVLDWILMSRCESFIIANSAFSWWAAWMGNSPTKKIVAPKRWFANGLPSEDIIPASWIRI